MTRGLSCVALLVVLSCKGTLDAGRNRVELPLDEPDAGATPPSATTSTPEPTTPTSTGTPSDDAGAPDAAAFDAGSLDAGSLDASSPDASSLDAGSVDAGPPAMPPFGPQSPIVILNDSATDNWEGELTLLALSTGRINLAGLIVNNSGYWPDVEVNDQGWQQMADAANESGLRNVPDRVVSDSPALVAPASGEIEATVPNDSAGGRFIRDAALRLGSVEQPLVVVSGSTLTDVADAYLLDATIAPRLIVLANLGQNTEQGTHMGGPNGDLDFWAASIVAQRMQFVQVTGYYEQVEDVPEARLGELPDNAFGAWMAAKQPDVTLAFAADQIALLAVLLPGFAAEFRRAAYVGWDPEVTSELLYQDDGSCWIMPQSNGGLAAQFLWELLQDPNTFDG